MNKKLMALTVASLAVLALSMGSVYADTSAGTTAAIKEKSSMKQAKDAITNNDYSTFETLYKSKTGVDISQENFNKLVQLESLRQQEQKLLKELKDAGVKMPGFNGMKMTRDENKDEDSKDAKNGKSDFSNRFTEDQIRIFEQADQLRKDGKFEEAKKLVIDAGIKINFDGKRGRGMHENGMMKYQDQQQGD